MTFFFSGTTAVKFTFIADNFPARLRVTGVTFAGSLAVNLGVAYGPLALGLPLSEWVGIGPTQCAGLHPSSFPAYASSHFPPSHPS